VPEIQWCLVLISSLWM